MESKIKDINLAVWERKELELAEYEMPGLMACRTEFGKSQPLKDTRITGSLHMTIQTAALSETLKCLGADIRWCSCNIFSTQDHAAATIVKNKSAVVFAWKAESLAEYWQCTMDALQFPNGKGPNQIVDDGGDATYILQLGLEYENKYKANKTLPDPSKVTSPKEIELLKTIKRYIEKDENIFSRLTSELHGVSEETTTGVLRLYQYEKQNKLLCPAFNVNDSMTKSKFDNVYGCRHSLPDGLNRATDLMIAGKKVCVCGYGDVGKGCAQAMSAAGCIVYVTEIDPINAPQACMQGYQVKVLEDIISEMDFVITATGNKNVVTIEHLKKMKHNAVLGNIGHFDNEIDMYALDNYPGIKVVNIKDQLDKYIFPDGKAIIILAQGRLLNLGCATGHPSFIMSNSFTNHTLAQIELKENLKTKKYEKKVYVLPKELDALELVAKKQPTKRMQTSKGNEPSGRNLEKDEVHKSITSDANGICKMISKEESKQIKKLNKALYKELQQLKKDKLKQALDQEEQC